MDQYTLNVQNLMRAALMSKLWRLNIHGACSHSDRCLGFVCSMDILWVGGAL